MGLWRRDIEKKGTGIFFLSARCPCAIGLMAAIDINHAHLVQWGHANSQRGVYNKSPRDERRSKMEKSIAFVQKIKLLILASLFTTLFFIHATKVLTLTKDFFVVLLIVL